MAESEFAVALVGASTLKGKELKEVLENRAFPVRRLALLDSGEEAGKLTEFDGEPVFVRPLSRESFAGVDFAFFTGSPAFTLNSWKLAEGAGSRMIDLTGALEREKEAGAVLAAPLAGEWPPAPGRAVALAHPAASVIALVIRRLAGALPVRLAVVNVFEPASERGSPGIEELHQQTVKLLSFQEAPSDVFGGQLAFNLLASMREDVRPSLADVEQRIARQVSLLLGSAPPRTAIRLLQAPTFHSHALSLYVELDGQRTVAELERALGGEGVDLRLSGQEAPTAAGAASSDDVLIGDIRRDARQPGGFWLWAAADNLRLQALDAVRLAEWMVGVKTG